MGRTLQDVMSERNISRYHLSKISGIPWATLSDICSGKTALERCSAGTVLKLSRALGMTMEETMDLETWMGPWTGRTWRPMSRPTSGKPYQTCWLREPIRIAHSWTAISMRSMGPSTRTTPTAE